MKLAGMKKAKETKAQKPKDASKRVSKRRFQTVNAARSEQKGPKANQMRALKRVECGLKRPSEGRRGPNEGRKRQKRPKQAKCGRKRAECGSQASQMRSASEPNAVPQASRMRSASGPNEAQKRVQRGWQAPQKAKDRQGASNKTAAPDPPKRTPHANPTPCTPGPPPGPGPRTPAPEDPRNPGRPQRRTTSRDPSDPLTINCSRFSRTAR